MLRYGPGDGSGLNFFLVVSRGGGFVAARMTADVQGSMGIKAKLQQRCVLGNLNSGPSPVNTRVMVGEAGDAGLPGHGQFVRIAPGQAGLPEILSGIPDLA